MSSSPTWWQPWTSHEARLLLDQDHRLLDHRLLESVRALLIRHDAEAASELASEAEYSPDVLESRPLMLEGHVMEELIRVCRADRFARRETLRSIWQRHTPDTISATQRVAVPNRLWDRLLAYLGEPPRIRPRAVWRDHESQVFAQGAQAGEWIEWWGLPQAPGVSYHEQLWAWGMVREPHEDPLGDAMWALSPRLAWRAEATRWVVHPHIERTCDAQPGSHVKPRFADGPGFLIACVVDAMAELSRLCSGVNGRELSIMWATSLLPVLAVSTASPVAQDRGATATPLSGPDPLPDCMHMLSFHMLHPRVQRILAVVYRICERLSKADFSSMTALCAALGRPRADSAEEALEQTRLLLLALVEHTLSWRAVADVRGGFGFELLGTRLHQELAHGLDVIGPSDYSSDHDRAVALAGKLSERLHDVINTALWHPVAPSDPGAPTTQQLTDLIWLRWTDPDFLNAY